MRAFEAPAAPARPRLTSPTYRLVNARVSAALVDDGSSLACDREGSSLVDLEVVEGRIARIVPARGASEEAGLDLDGGHVWPCPVDMHTHLDKGHIWPRATNEDGTHQSAARRVAADRRSHWSAEDVGARFDFGLACAYAHGTAAMRTHLDCYELAQADISFGVFRDRRAAWRDRLDLQAVAMTHVEKWQGADGARLADLSADSGASLGGIVRILDHVSRDENERRLDAALDALLDLAAARGLDVDLHVDETLDPDARALCNVARAVLRKRFRGRVTVGHCCSLSMQADEEISATLALCREAQLAVVALPMVNLYLQGREPHRTPRHRGLTPLHEWRAAGVRTAVASDNCRDPFFAFGDLDMVEVFREAVRIGHLDMPLDGWLATITSTPADIMGLPNRGRLCEGAPADLVLFRGRTFSELLSRPQADRIVLRRGLPIERTLPDHRSLDTLFDNGVVTSRLIASS